MRKRCEYRVRVIGGVRRCLHYQHDGNGHEFVSSRGSVMHFAGATGLHFRPPAPYPPPFLALRWIDPRLT